MDFDRHLADADIAGDLLIETAADNVLHYFALAGRERLEALAHRTKRLFALAPRPIACQAKLNRIQQILIAKWLGQELNRSALHCLHGHRHVTVSRDENDREFDVRCCEVALVIQTAAHGQSYVQDQAGRAGRRLGLEKIRQRVHCPRLKTHATQEGLQRFADICVIIDDQDSWLRQRHVSTRAKPLTMNPSGESRQFSRGPIFVTKTKVVLSSSTGCSFYGLINPGGPWTL